MNKKQSVIGTYFTYLKLNKNTSKGTLKEYKSDLKAFFKFLNYDIEEITTEVLVNITTDDISNYLIYIENERQNKVTTRVKKMACLKSFFTFQYENGIVDYNLSKVLILPKLPKKTPVFLNEEEIIKLLDSCIGRNKIRDKTIIILFLNTGITLSELCNINLSDIYVDSIIIKGIKKRERKVYLNSITLKYLSDYLVYRKNALKSNQNIDALFISERKQRISSRTVELIFKKALIKGELPLNYSINNLRHTFANSFYKSDYNIKTLQGVLGHTNLASTNIYKEIYENNFRNKFENNQLGI